MKTTYDESILSDLFKDTYNMRPNASFMARWNDADEAGKQGIWDGLVVDQANAVDRQQAKDEMFDRMFEDQVSDMMELGASTRSDAIRWIFDAEMPGADISNEMDVEQFLVQMYVSSTKLVEVTHEIMNENTSRPTM